MILIKDFQDKTQRLADYGDLLSKNVDPAEAATRSFGDLRKLDEALHDYVRQERFYGFKMPATTQIDESTFKVQPLTAAQSDALRADFLAYNQRITDARLLLDHVLKDDPNNTSAHETMGFLEFREGHIEEARKWYAQAVQLDSQSFLAQYYFAAISMNGSRDSADDAKVESSLRNAIKLNPSFAPTYDLMAAFLASRHRDLQEAHMMGLQAVSLEPGNVRFRINVANVLLQMHQTKNAVNVLRMAAKLAKTPEEVQSVDNFLMHVQEYEAEQEQIAEPQKRLTAERNAGTASADRTVSDANIPTLKHRDPFVARGPHRFIVGVLKNVHCDTPQIDLTVDAGAKTLTLRGENYYKLPFTALDFSPSADLNPCKDLEGRPAKVEYIESADQSSPARLLSVELHNK